jgi:predicted 2-oxoglutarate/Fe(II)-dependent dioxygenase YbiX
MLLTIPGLLNAAQLAQIHATLEGAECVDGRHTAGFAADRVTRRMWGDR